MSRLVSPPALDGREYVCRVHAPPDALPADLFRCAFHRHDDGPHPRTSDRFDAARIRPVATGARTAREPGGLGHRAP
ncbi:hypothetical protein FKN01_18205 [Streptomyces sp. 130]|uniref:hypothetical protein n=1 Tax=Streptomyces sp. 130 TaxID=2591006 RepID=UPI00117FFC7D|nr:hypothetical protein [Streptomyces sp. 130]TRV76710.1 hypothetical protein FKN01_18205 [Streptomyces sp. 130]